MSKIITTDAGIAVSRHELITRYRRLVCALEAMATTHRLDRFWLDVAREGDAAIVNQDDPDLWGSVMILDSAANRIDAVIGTIGDVPGAETAKELRNIADVLSYVANGYDSD